MTKENDKVVKIEDVKEKNIQSHLRKLKAGGIGNHRLKAMENHLKDK